MKLEAAFHCALLVLSLGSIACNRAPAAGGEKGAPGKPSAESGVVVRVAPVQRRMLKRSVEVSGSLASPNDSQLAAEVEGKVAGVKVDLGDRVQTGQVLARINPVELRLRMEQAEALRAQAEANLRRMEQLAKSEMVAPRELDDARAQAAQARAASDLARKKFTDTEVRAPFAGAIAKRLVSSGEFVKIGQPLFQIVSLDPLKLTGEVPERYVSQVRVGDPVNVQIDALSTEPFEGQVSRIGPTVSEKSRTFTVEARVANKKGQLKPGIFAKAILQLGSEEEVLVVPEEAVTTFAGVAKVFSVAGGVAKERRVMVEQHVEGGVVVSTSDLKPDEPVAVTSLGRLADGVPVVIK